MLGCLARHGLLVAICCSLLLTSFTPAAPTRPSRFLLLSERPPALIEYDPTLPKHQQTLRSARLPLQDFGNRGPEGIALIPNADVERFGLPQVEGHGYIIVTIEAKGQLYFLEWRDDNSIQRHFTRNLPQIENDISALQYQDGTLWVMASSQHNLYEYDLATLIATNAPARIIYPLETIKSRYTDIEGIYIEQPAVSVLANDSGQELLVIDTYSDCLEDFNCQVLQRFEPIPDVSDITWDSVNNRFIFVSGKHDYSQISELNLVTEEIRELHRIWTDLEGIVAVP